MTSEMSINRMFVVIASLAIKEPAAREQNCFKLVAEDEAQLWHCRYGHLSYKGLKTLYNKKMVRGLPLITAPTKVCEGCMLGKHHRDPFPKQSQWRASRRLQLIHADICGPITPISLSNRRYLITFIDDYSRKIWVQFITEKSEAFVNFKKFKVLIEGEIGENIGSLRTDRGESFVLRNSTHFVN